MKLPSLPNTNIINNSNNYKMTLRITKLTMTAK